MANPIGRPMKYRRFITMLEDEKIYCPATIVRLGEEKGLFNPDLDKERLKKVKMKVRHSLARFSSNHMFPRDGDGHVERIHGQPPLRGWTGKRWKEHLPPAQ